MRNKIYFVSDAHLGSQFHGDPLAVERKLVAWLKHISPEAKAIYFVGDMFDYWFEYKHVVPRGFVRFLGQCATMADEGIELHFMAGNHDLWMTDYFEKELGAKIHHRAIEFEDRGKRFFLSHGDEEYRSERKINDLLYRIFRIPFLRGLYAAVHPRWTVGIAHALSLQSRNKGLRMHTEGRVPHSYINDYFEVENEWLIRKAKEYSQLRPQIDFFIFGHRHLLVDMLLPNEKRALILGDWIQYDSWAEWNGNQLALRTMEDFQPYHRTND
ncbi:MAG: UDP-2,3-diacylglucosamine diphosphatase [Porphyromonas sp.]|nr:UDP-2,3-diacylglucosamine diphosphatase [Porphyromonas sp.]